MSSSWFSSIISGSKKKQERVTVVEASEITEEGFTVIEPQPPYPPAPLYPSVPPPSSAQPLPYPVLSSNHVLHRTDSSSPSHISKPHHYLDSIPFVLNPKLENATMSQQDLLDLEAIRRAIVQLTADVSDNWFDYDFKTERNVLKELTYKNEN